MKTVERILKQLRRSVCSDDWLFPTLLDALDGVTAEMAARRPLADSHSIWEITRHLAIWETAAARMAAGGTIERTQRSHGRWDWPEVRDTGPDAWTAALNELKSAHETLMAVVSGLDEAALDRAIQIEGFTVLDMLQGVIEHNMYHAGQIALLKRAAG